MTTWWSVRVTTNLDSLNPSVSRADFFILRGTCKTRCYIIEKQGRSRCFNAQKCVIFSISLCLQWWLLWIQWKTCIHCKCMGLRKNSTSGMVDVKYHISWEVNSQTANSYDEDLVSFIKDRVLSPNALQQVTVGLQCSKSFSLLTQKGQNCSKIERLRARTIPWFFGHFWKCSEVVVENYFWTLSKNCWKIKGSFLLWAFQLLFT